MTESTLQTALGLVLHGMRRRKKLRLRDVQDKCGVSLGYISQIERGANLPSLTVVVSLVGAYDTTLTALFGAVEKEMES